MVLVCIVYRYSSRHSI